MANKSVIIQPAYAPFKGRPGFRVVSAHPSDTGYLLSEHLDQGEAEWRCDEGNRDRHARFVVTDSTGRVLYGRL